MVVYVLYRYIRAFFQKDGKIKMRIYDIYIEYINK